MSKIVLEDFNEGDGYYKVNLAYLSKEQVEEIEALVSKWNPTDETIKACIGMALTDVPETRFKSYGVSLKECLDWLEKQKYDVSPQMVADAYLRGCNDTEKKWLEKQCKQDDYDDNIITRDDEILQAISVGLTDVAKDAGWSDFGGIPIEDIMDWLEKQVWKKEYTFKSIPRLLDMIEPTERAKAYCQKLIDTLINEGYAADAKIVCECLRKMCGEKVALATMDDQKINKSDDERIRKAQLDYWRSVGGKEWHGVPVQETIAWLEKQAPKPKWSDEDEELLQHCCGAIAAADYYTLEDKEEMETWLKSLKKKMGNEL